MERINVHLANRQIKVLDFIADSSGLRRSEIIRRAIDEYIDHISKIKPEILNEKCVGYTGWSGVVNECK